MATGNTPMMQQYWKMRDENLGFLLFYRMGDFYELFDDHAITAAGILGITLTRRRSAKDGDEGIPMCGVPFHAAEGYIAKLLDNGHKVALCEQTETPEDAKKKRGYKAVVNREVVRLYTGGTLTEESMLKAEENNYLLALTSENKTLHLAYVDVSTGEFKTTTTTADHLSAELSRLNPKEIILTESTGEKFTNELNIYADILSVLTARYFNYEQSQKLILSTLKVKTLESFGFEHNGQITVCGALIQYIKDTQTGKLPTLQNPKVIKKNAYLYIDPMSRQGLELTQTLKGERKGSLMSVLDKTVTAPGSRALAQWVNTPLQDLSEIQDRQNVITALIKQGKLLNDIQHALKNSADMHRAISRITLERGSPRDLLAIRHTLSILPDLSGKISSIQENRVQKIQKTLQGFEPLSSLLEKSLENEVPMLARDGGFIRSGFCNTFDAHKELAVGGMDMLKALEKQEAERTGITSLRIKYNKVWGYFMEVTNLHKDKVPNDFIHRQTTTNSQRFSSTLLMELERKYAAAEANMNAREQELFKELVAATSAMAPELIRAADALAELDVLTSAAVVAKENNYCRPSMDNSLTFNIQEGRHPVVEQTVEHYIANNSQLSDGAFWLITGPNMAGKSTFLRQNALITIMAHAGFYVPATSAHIGLVDRIFTRIGAADDLSRGQSTFMMEMVETAAIINGATEKSLVILDEIGRGTATYDGLSIAWACTEHLVTTNKSRGLFATHYHEMADLATAHEKLHCYHVQVKEWEGDVIFLHKITEGVAPGSYGIHVGRLAGLPKSVTRRAQQILNRLEKQAGTAGNLSPVDLPLFVATEEKNIEPSDLEIRLQNINPDDLSPKDAHSILYDLKGLLN
jgi:DNA mismatch repair protein MutS